MVRRPRSPLCALIALAWVALAGVLSSGCGGLAFRVAHRIPPRVSLETASALWIAIDPTDPLARRLADRLAQSLGSARPTRIVAVGRAAELDVVVLTIALRRSVTHRTTTVMQSEWQCDPTGSCFPRQVPRLADLQVVRLLARVSVHDGASRILDPARVLDVSESGDDDLGAELRLVARLAEDIAVTFLAVDEVLTLPVDALADARAHVALEQAVESPSAARCAAIALGADEHSERDERARVLHASGICRFAVALASEPVDVAELRRAEALVLSAVRLRPAQRYAQAVVEVRRALARARPRARVEIEGEPTIPEGYE